MWLPVLKLASAEYEATNFQIEIRKVAVVAPVVKKLRHWSFHVVVMQRTAKKFTKNYNTCMKPLFCSFYVLFGDVLVTVAVVFCVRTLLRRQRQRKFC